MKKSKIPSSALPPQDPPERYSTGVLSSDVMTPNQILKVLERMSDRLREMWIITYRNYISMQTSRPCNYHSSVRWDGGKDSSGKVYKSVWPKLALMICQDQLDPQALVNAQFENRVGSPPSPTLMGSSTGLTNYRLYKNQIIPELKRALASQKLALEMALFQAKFLYEDEVTAYKSVLYDEQVQMTALFRYCLARKTNLPTVASDWHQAALEQYLCEPSCYDQVWGDILPQNLKKQADTLSRSFSTYGSDLLKGIGDYEQILAEARPDRDQSSSNRRR